MILDTPYHITSLAKRAMGSNLSPTLNHNCNVRNGCYARFPTTIDRAEGGCFGQTHYHFKAMVVLLWLMVVCWTFNIIVMKSLVQRYIKLTHLSVSCPIGNSWPTPGYKAYIVMKNISCDVIKKGKKGNLNSYGKFLNA